MLVRKGEGNETHAMPQTKNDMFPKLYILDMPLSLYMDIYYSRHCEHEQRTTFATEPKNQVEIGYFSLESDFHVDIHC